MQSVLLRAEPLRLDDLITELWEYGTSGIIEEHAGIRAFFENADALGCILTKHSDLVIEMRREPSIPYSFSTGDWDPIAVGDRFWIAPSWVDRRAPAGRYRLTVDGTKAFGSGRHESTQLVLEALELLPLASAVVLDVGCGSGILSMAAGLLGAAAVLACDIDPASVELTRPHASAVFLGSADSVRAAAADVVLANISAKAIDRLAQQLQRVVRPDGWLILAGFIEENPPKSFVPVQTLARGEWLCWLCRPPPRPLPEASEPLLHPLEWW